MCTALISHVQGPLAPRWEGSWTRTALEAGDWKRLRFSAYFVAVWSFYTRARTARVRD